MKKAIDSIASDIVSCAMPVETPKASFTAGMAGMNRWSDSGPMKVMETSAMKKYQRGRKGIVMGKIFGVVPVTIPRPRPCVLA